MATRVGRRHGGGCDEDRVKEEPMRRHRSQSLDEWLGFDLPLIVHDLKSPISAIALEMYVLMETAGGARRGLFQEVATRVLRNIEFVDRMVQDLLDSAAMDAGELQLERAPTDLRSLVHGV